MGKIVRFDASRRQQIGGTGQSFPRGGSSWDPSYQFIIGFGIAAFIIIFTALHYWQSQSYMATAYGNNSIIADTERASFGFCHSGGGQNCVVDGDTFYYRGNKIRIADIDTPETHDYGCDSELKLGDAARVRMQQLLNASAFSLTNIERDTDRYGRLLRNVERNGQSLGGILVDEGLARWYNGRRRSWC
jgi:micrococcal nuclease